MKFVEVTLLKIILPLCKFVGFYFVSLPVFFHNLVKYYSISKVLDNFQQPMERAVKMSNISKKKKGAIIFEGHPKIYISKF